MTNIETKTEARWDIARWQRELREQPKVYWTRSRDMEPTGNFYSTREVDYCARKGERITIMESPMHNLKLSEERWNHE